MRRAPFSPPSTKAPMAVRVERVAATGPGEVLVDGELHYLTEDELNRRAFDSVRMVQWLVEDSSEKTSVHRYLWQDQIYVDPLTRPRSHPRLVLDAEYSATEEDRELRPSYFARQLDMLRSVLVHEQIHLFLGPLNRRINPSLGNLIRDLKSIPALRQIPVSPILIERIGEERARAGTDLHIVVNWLELQANKRFMGGDDQARELVASIAAYEDIYRAVIDCDAQIAQIVREPQHRHFEIEVPHLSR